MSWYDYVACFVAGTFLANVVPHFVHGISGEPFPTRFARPLVKGLSSPPVNVAWTLINFIVGYVLFRVGKIWSGDGSLVAFFAGIVALSLWLSVLFAKRQASISIARPDLSRKRGKSQSRTNVLPDL